MNDIAIITTSEVSSYPPLVLVLNPDSKINDIPERVVRTPTLDGGAVLYSLGKTDADRTFVLESALDLSTFQALDLMRNDYSDFNLALPDGVYHGMISDISVSDKIQITFLPDGKI